MTVLACALSHSPLIGEIDPGAGVLDEIETAVAEVRRAIEAFDPEVTVVFGPDHFNGVFYDMMPPFCIGSAASSVGDWGTRKRALPVDADAARRLVDAALEADIDVAQSERLYVDHGMAQSLEMLFGADYERPIVPVFINAVGLPLGPMRRVRRLGEAIGREIASWDKRVLVLGSGGLSHDPPVPKLAGASDEIRERLIDGRDYTPEQRRERQRRVIEAALAQSGETPADIARQQPLDEEFDRMVMATLASGSITSTDGWANDWMAEVGGGSAHEIRTWVATFAAAHAATGSDIAIADQWYWPVHAWGNGFGIMLSEPVARLVERPVEGSAS
ncbi:3-carboxyethylcatechol 2,3-dioxygenase [Nocardioides nematodiphilus]|uniref:3-carboxyethylcatechol 2,3-dioxygenase n=1 Tax=Nocardioides nematodiphilus TaxID=2849669 RepID=UPI001CD9B46B|nr:3-carboxyethylcatechol 2,3-dioxygenase [Nocardioides nematodiphilus]MCA1983092.1 3-carboxyethylcatechol 2,3-dioxygenase [Nocardioides nematodiphilus]